MAETQYYAQATPVPSYRYKFLRQKSERARTLIREFYTRVESANNYFTSYLEGWKTDRGIIYIIYGVPNVVYKNKDYENWIYGEENNMMSINFTFHRVNNPASNNDFSLSRSPAPSLTYSSTQYKQTENLRNLMKKLYPFWYNI